MRVPKGLLERARRRMRVPKGFVKPARGDIGRALIVVLAVLAGCGESLMIVVLPSDAGGSAQQRRPATLASAPASPAPLQTALLAAAPSSSGRAGPDYYRRTSARHVPRAAEAGFLPLYRVAARSFGVSWRLIASIHRQETAFSTEPSTYHGLNAFGCCAGPMQFNVTNGPPSTWALYRRSFDLGERPRAYPHRTRHHPSIYDDFDAIMAAAALLSDSGATDALDGSSWSAAYAYYGHDLFGIDYASEVLGRASGWERDGFCVNCPVDASLVADFDDAYGADARRVLLDDKLREKRAKAKAKERRRRRRAARARRRAAAEARRR
ncbi:MAG: hypothetical protein QOI73_2504, partial [Solirubrobacteraceae bacterium]|nr:hypothetical protein [Solirubrobacteraceae bacterium]